MAHVIAVAGKGGVGKTTLCGLLIQYLCESGKGPVLAVDADANSNLNEVLGVEVEATLGDIREEIARAEMASKNPITAGMRKADYAEFKFAGALIWNFAHTDLNLKLPKDVIVENVHLSESLMRLSYNLTRYEAEHPKNN